MDRSAEFKKLIDLIVHTTHVKDIETALTGIYTINEVDILSHSPLYYAVTTNSSVQVLNTLIKRGAIVEFSHVKEAVIHNSNPEIAINLYELIKPLTQRDLDYLFLLSASNRSDYRLLHFFVEEGASLEATIGIDLYPDWEDVLDFPTEVNDLVMVEQNAIVLAFYENPSPLAIVKELIHLGVDVNYVDSVGNSILSHVLDDLDFLKVLVEEGNADINICDALGKTPLMSACEGENVGVALYLIEKDQHVNRMSKEQKTALHYALSCHLCNNYEVVTSLIAHGADITLEDGEGNSPLLIAREHFAHGEVIKYLEDKLIQMHVVS